MCLLALLAAGCVVGASRRPTAAEAASGPPPPPDRDGTAGDALLPPHGEALPDAPPGPAPAGKAWRVGYWHWDGTQYVWVAGHWEATPRVVP
jgi:hypothetical protein